MLDSDPSPDQVAQLAQEIYNNDLLQALVLNIHKFDFEASTKHLSLIYTPADKENVWWWGEVRPRRMWHRSLTTCYDDKSGLDYRRWNTFVQERISCLLYWRGKHTDRRGRERGALSSLLAMNIPRWLWTVAWYYANVYETKPWPRLSYIPSTFTCSLTMWKWAPLILRPMHLHPSRKY